MNKKRNSPQGQGMFRKGIAHLAHKPWFLVFVVLVGILLLFLFMYFSARTNIVGQGVLDEAEVESPSVPEPRVYSSNILGYALAGLAALGGGLAAYLRWRRVEKKERRK